MGRLSWGASEHLQENYIHSLDGQVAWEVKHMQAGRDIYVLLTSMCTYHIWQC